MLVNGSWEGGVLGGMGGKQKAVRIQDLKQILRATGRARHEEAGEAQGATTNTGTLVELSPNDSLLS